MGWWGNMLKIKRKEENKEKKRGQAEESGRKIK
jgi:hypothetical protein